MKKYPRKSEAAKRRMNQVGRDSVGKFSATKKNSAQTPNSAILPPQSDVDYRSMFVALPNPVNDIFYNPDEAFLSNQENASRMIQDMAIYSALQEREIATAGLPWSIVPTDENDPMQKEAADHLEKVIRNHLPNTADFFRNLLDAVWFGRMGAYLSYEWDFSRGYRCLVPTEWTPVHGDSLVFAEGGRIGYLVGVVESNQRVIVGVTGRTIMVDDLDITDGVRYFAPAERKAWVVHHGQKTAGEFRVFTSAASKYGLGLRSRCYPIWLLKQSALQFQMQAAEKFGAGWVIGYFDGSNQQSADAVRDSLQKQVGSCVSMFPRFAPEAQAVEGVDVINPPTGGEYLLDIVNYFDKQLRMTICGESLTADNENGAGLGSNLAEVQQSTFARLVKYDSSNLAATLTGQLVSVLQEFSPYRRLPPCRFEFSHDIGSTADKIDNAKKLYDMGIKVDPTELLRAAGFTVATGTTVEQDADVADEINAIGSEQNDAGRSD